MGRFLDDKFKIIIIVVLVVLILLVTGGGFFLYSMFNNQDSGEPKEYYPDNIALIEIEDPIMANIVGGANTGRMIRATVSFGVDSDSKKYADLVAMFENQLAVIRDRVGTVMRNQTYEELMLPGGEEKLKIEIKDALNELTGFDIIFEVYFKDILIQ